MGFEQLKEVADFKSDEVKLSANATQASEVLREQAISTDFNKFAWQKLGIAAGAGAASGAIITSGAEFVLTKTAEPMARFAGSIAFGVIGGGKAAAEILYAPPLRAIECITPKYALAGAAIGATIAFGAYELYESAFNKK